MSVIKPQEINLDFTQNSYKDIVVKQNDVNSRSVIVTCTNNGEKCPLDKNVQTCNIKMKTPDNRPIYNPTTILSDGRVQIDFTEQMVLVGGKVDAELEVINSASQQIIHTMNLHVIIVSSVYDNDEIVASPEFDALNEALLSIKESSVSQQELDKKVDKVDGKGLSTNDYTNADKEKLDSISANAESNQNAFSNVIVGSTTIKADSKTDSLTLVAGNNVTLTPDATNDKVTITATDTKYTHPTTSGNKHIPSGGSSGQILRWSADGTAEWGDDSNTTYKEMIGATSSTDGKSGLVPAPIFTDNQSFLRGDGTWQKINAVDSIQTGMSNGTITVFDKFSNAKEVAVQGLKSAAYTESTDYAKSSHGTHVTYSIDAPIVAGTASAGTATTVSRSDHVHPAQTTISGNAGTATQLQYTQSYYTKYSSDDTHILRLGYWNCTTSVDNFTILFSSSSIENQHGSCDIISLRQDGNPDNTIKCTLSRTKLMDSTREFYYKIDNNNKRIYLYVYVIGGTDYGFWNTSIIQSKGGSWVSEYYPSQESDNTFVIIDDVYSLTSHSHSVVSTTTDGLMTASDKTKLDSIATNANNYIHPNHTAKNNGLYKVTVDNTGHVSNAISVTKEDITALGIPANDTNTHYTSKNVVGGSMATSNTASALTNGNVYLNSVENGAVTSTHKISGSGATTVTTDANGNIIISSTDNNTTYKEMVGATSGTDGKSGLVPIPVAGNQASFLCGDGTWKLPNVGVTNVSTGSLDGTIEINIDDGTGVIHGSYVAVKGLRSAAYTDSDDYATASHSHSNATTNIAGLMSTSDKTKLDGIATGANNYTHPSYTAKNNGLYKVTVDGTGHVSAATAVTKSDITALGIPAQDTVYTLPTASSTLGGVKTTSTVTSTSGLTACPIISGVPYYKDTNTTYSLGSFGITASANELNYVDGVTSNIQTQLNSKATLGNQAWFTGINLGSDNSAIPYIYNENDNIIFRYKDGGGNTQYTNINAIITGLAGKASTSHGTHVTYGTSVSALGTSSAGSATTVSRSDHVHALPALTSCIGTLSVEKGGTGATTADAALTNLGAAPATHLHEWKPFLDWSEASDTSLIGMFPNNFTELMIAVNVDSRDIIASNIFIKNIINQQDTKSYRFGYFQNGGEESNGIGVIVKMSNNNIILSNVFLNGTNVINTSKWCVFYR